MKRLFLSYSYENQHFAHLLKAQLISEQDLQIIEFDPVASNSENYIKRVITDKIKEASMIIALLPANSRWVDWELSTAKKSGVPILGVLINTAKENIGTLSNRLGIPVINWSFESLVDVLKNRKKTIDYQTKIITESKIIKIDFEKINYELTQSLIKNPSEMYKLNPRRYEELVAYLFEKMGYEVELTQQTRDGGVDIYALKKEPIGKFLTIVECKRYSPDNPVGAEIVRHMNGVLDLEKASHGVIAATSYFTPDAYEIQRRLEYRLSLKEHADIINWMKSI